MPTDLIKGMFETKIRADLRLDSDKPNEWKIFDLISKSLKIYYPKGSYAELAATEDILNDDKIVKYAEKHGMMDTLEKARENVTEAKLFGGAVSPSDSVVSKSLNELLDREDRRAMMLVIADRMTFFPKDVVDRLKQLNDSEINFALSQNEFLPGNLIRHLINEKDPRCFVSLLKHCNNADVAKEVLEKAIKEFDEIDMEYILPEVADYYASLEPYEAEVVSGAINDFYNKCSQIPMTSLHSQECLERLERSLGYFEQELDEQELGRD